MVGRGRPNREGSILRGLSLFGEEGAAEEGGAAAGRNGDSGRAAGPGEADRTTFAGDCGRPRREIPETEGLAGLGTPATSRETAIFAIAGAAAGSALPWVLGPGTRRSRSSSWVLSLEDKGPTKDQTFSPTREYASLESN